MYKYDAYINYQIRNIFKYMVQLPNIYLFFDMEIYLLNHRIYKV
jgi:hypothetical protein